MSGAILECYIFLLVVLNVANIGAYFATGPSQRTM